MKENVKQEKMILGIIGALLCALISSVVWILLDQVGFIASFAAIIIMLASFKGYEFLGGKLSKKGIVACVIITVLTVLVADYVSLGISIYRELSSEYEITLWDSIYVAGAFFEEPEILSSFLINLAMGYLFVAIGCFRTVKNVWISLGEQQPAENKLDLASAATYVNEEIPEEAFVSED